MANTTQAEPVADSDGLSLEWAVALRDSYPSDRAVLDWARAALSDVSAQVHIRIADCAEMRAANLRWRQADYATNVLSFPADLPDLPGFSLLGDILICAEVVNAEAVAQGKPRDAHWAHMLIHGILHLRGYEHDSARDAAQMEALEIEILGRLSIADPYLVRDGAIDALNS